MVDPSDNSCTAIACSWTPARQDRCSYTSHVKLFYDAHDRGVWSIGSDTILKERPHGGPKIEVKILDHLATHTNIPVPKVLHHWARRAILCLIRN